jgi:hypothetical protein
MRRLRDLDSPGAEEARLVELLRAAEPTVRSDGHMRRVRAALDVTPGRAGWRPRWSASVAMPLLLLIGVAAASAASGLAWVQRHRVAIEASKRGGLRSDEKAPASSVPRAASVLPAEIATVAPAAPTRSTHGPTERGPSRRSSRLVRVAVQDPAPSEDVARDDRSSLWGVRIVSSALAAMRRSHEPKVASDLLERYLNEEPDGPFAEEALGLAIEAAADADEAARAASRARRYLDAYPTGRFVSVAQRALRRFSAPADGSPPASD